MNGRNTSVGVSRREIEDANAFERDLFGMSAAPMPMPGRPAPRPGMPAPRPMYRSRGGLRGYREDTENWESQDTERIVGGSDDRVQVLARSTNPSTTLFPFNTICHIQRATGGRGSGTLIAPRVVLTAGHVLKGTTGATITPGFNATATTAAEQRPASPGDQTVASSTFRFHPTLDLGLVLFPTAFTRPTRFMMLQPRGDINTATLLTIAGYPRVQGPGGQVSVAGTMWRHSDKLPITGVTPTHLKYPIDTEPGQSGSPLWLLGNDEIRLLLGVHIQGGDVANTGVRITCAVIDWIEGECRTASITPLPIVDNVQRRRVCPGASQP